MSITSYTFTPFGQFTLATVTSDLVDPTYFWYLDGTYYDRTSSPELTVYLQAGDQADIVAVDTTTPDTFDVVANAPQAGPARNTLWWVRSTDLDVASYIIKQEREAEGFVTIGEVPASDVWSYRFISPRLDDLTLYRWEVLPVDQAGNEGTALAFAQRLIVRRPDAPDFTITFDGGTTRVEFAAA